MNTEAFSAGCVCGLLSVGHRQLSTHDRLNSKYHSALHPPAPSLVLL